MEEKVIETKNYFVYNDGRIFSKRKKKFLKFRIDKYGYYSFNDADNKGKTRTLNRKIYECFNGEIPKKGIITYIDGNKLNNNLNNLKLLDEGGTYRGNYTGVYKIDNEWKVVVKGKIIGFYETFEEASIIRDFMVKIYRERKV